MVAPRSRRSRSHAGAIVVGGVAVGLFWSLGLLAVMVLSAPPSAPPSCASPGFGATAIVLAPADGGVTAGASEYGGPGDPSSGTVGASGQSLVAHPDSFAELGGDTFAAADALGRLPYLTPLRISWGPHSAIAYKRDFGFGGGPVEGLPRVIDLWWRFASALSIPYDNGRWSGAVRLARLPGTGAAGVLGQVAAMPVQAAGVGSGPATPAGGDCVPSTNGGVPQTSGPRALLLPGDRAAAPAGAPAAVDGIIAAGNAIAGRPYVYGAAHGMPLDELAPAYDCSSSVEHLLYGGGLLPAGYGAASSALESFGVPGPGRWVTIYASATHVFMYVAGLRWDTWNAAGPADGTTGIGWHPLVRSAAGFVVRHPVGL